MSYISSYRNNDRVVVWERTEDGRITKEYPAPFEFYVEHDRGRYKSIFNKKLTKIECKSYDHMKDAVQQCIGEGRATYESDISPDLKILAKHYYNVPAPKLHVTFYDIENDYDPEKGYATVAEGEGRNGPYAPINAIALHHAWKKESVVIVVPPPGFDVEKDFDKSLHDLSKIVFCKNEKELLLRFLREIEDTDCLSGWNSKFFDDPYVCKRIEQVFGKKKLDSMSFPNCGQNTVRFREVEMFGKVNTTVDFRGRISFDYMDLFKKYEMNQRPSYKLEAIADEILPHLPKLAYTGSLAELYRNNFNWFVRYNIRDTEILKGFEEQLGYVDLANVMYHSATGTAAQVFGTIRLADLAIINYCHNVLNVMVPDWVPKEDGSIEGALVLYPQIGMHKWGGSVDINSLYPSAIRSINISPETLVGQFVAKERAWKAIFSKTDEELMLEYEDGSTETHTAEEWRDVLKDNVWAVSGYGTVFNQAKQGVIPSILADWYAQRKKYQKLKVELYDKAKAVGKDNPTYQELMDKSTYYDRLQYVYKIKLNSTYGALTNYRFRFFDLRTGESTTGTGRQILRHQIRKIGEVLDGNYNFDFPLYGTPSEAAERGHGQETSLHGQHFDGKFQSESILYGDTDSCYFATHAENQKEATIIADHVADVVNDSFPAFMRDAFLCHPGFDTLIKSGREVVFDCGIFVDKKRYVLHLVDLDGKIVDKLKVMGLEMRKTTTPKVIQDFLKDVVTMILRGDDWDDINNFIIKYRDDVVYHLDLVDIGLPKGVKKVEEYYQKKLMVRDAEGKKYAIPGHVSASLHYNACLEMYGDKASNPIVSDMKIKVFYLKEPKNGFKSIALPTDIEEIPTWFTENFEIDRALHAEKLIDNNLGHIFNAIQQEVPTRQTMLINSLYGF